MGHVWLKKGCECPRLRDVLGSQSGKGKGIRSCDLEEKARERAGEPGIKQVKGTKETEVPSMARRSLPHTHNKGMGQVSITRSK